MRRCLVALTTVLTVALGLAVPTPAVAAGPAQHVLVVPRDFPTIQAAVDAAAPGDLVDVRRGTYTAEIVIDKDLESWSPDPASHIKSATDCRTSSADASIGNSPNTAPEGSVAT